MQTLSERKEDKHTTVKKYFCEVCGNYEDIKPHCNECEEDTSEDELEAHRATRGF